MTSLKRFCATILPCHGRVSSRSTRMRSLGAADSCSPHAAIAKWTADQAISRAEVETAANSRLSPISDHVRSALDRRRRSAPADPIARKAARGRRSVSSSRLPTCKDLRLSGAAGSNRPFRNGRLRPSSDLRPFQAERLRFEWKAPDRRLRKVVRCRPVAAWLKPPPPKNSQGRCANASEACLLGGNRTQHRATSTICCAGPH